MAGTIFTFPASHSRMSVSPRGGVSACIWCPVLLMVTQFSQSQPKDTSPPGSEELLVDRHLQAAAQQAETHPMTSFEKEACLHVQEL